MYFDRFDICEAYLALEADYNVGGILWERPSNARRWESIGVQLHRIGFKGGLNSGSYEHLTENGKAIYDSAVEKWGLPK